MNTQQQEDIAAIVGEMEDIACEHSQHGTHPYHTDQPASHYLKALCPTCGYATNIYAACPSYVQLVQAGAPTICSRCRTQRSALEAFTILGPVNA